MTLPPKLTTPRRLRDLHPVIVLCGLGGIAVLILLTVGAFFGGPPTDESLVRQFTEHRAEFERLREMMAEDPYLGALYWGASTNKLANGQIIDEATKEARHREYLSLLKRAGASVGIRDEEEFRFPVAASGFASKGYRIAVTWRETEPAPLLKSLDDFRKTKTGWDYAYRKLDEGWYLWIIW